MFVSAGLDLKVHIYKDGKIEEYPTQCPSSTKIVTVSVCNDNSYIAVLRADEKPQILSAKDLRNVRLIHTINVSNVTTLTFKHNTKKIIALGTSGGDVIMYDTKARTVANMYPKVTETVEALDFTCDDQQLCGFDGSTFFIFPDVNNSSFLKRYKQSSECTYLKCHAFILNRAILGCKNGSVGVWDVQMGTELVHIEVFQSPILGVSMSSCGNFLIMAGPELKICGLDYETGTCSFQYVLDQEKTVSSLDLSSDDKLLSVGLNDGTLKIYDVKEQLQQLYTAKVHDSSVNIIVFENKGKEINSSFSSIIKLASEHEVKEKDSICSKISCLKKRVEHKDDSLEKIKKSVLKMIKNEMECLENQLNEHCAKFQKFLDNEFETIDGIIKKKWDVFNLGDINQIMKAICPDETKSGFE